MDRVIFASVFFRAWGLQGGVLVSCIAVVV